MESVTPVPKKNKLEKLSDVRKISSTSDFSKIFEKYLKQWIFEDISEKLSPSQYGGRQGTGTEHCIVNFVDRILHLLDSSDRCAVIVSCADWRNAFDRQDPTKTISKFIRIGVRSSLVPILSDYLRNRRMKVKMNGIESEIKDLVGGSPQGTLLGQLLYIGSSDDAASEISEDDKFKYVDDLEIIELLSLAGALLDYDFYQHVASDVGIDQQFLPPSAFEMQDSLENLSSWTRENKMQLNDEKSNYMIFNRGKTDFTTRLKINGCNLDQVKVTKLLGVWISEDLSWTKNCQEISKKAYTRIKMLSKLKYAGMKTEDLINIYILHIRSVTEYCSTAFHSSLTVEQSRKLESIQRTALRVILRDMYVSYEAAMEMTGLKLLHTRHDERCLSYVLKAVKHPVHRTKFPQTHVEDSHNIREREQYHVNFARTEAYRQSAVLSLQRLLNAQEEGRTGR